MTDERLKPGNCHKCGLPMSDNPHAEAGKPAHYLDVGCPRECIPCLVHGRHQWAGRAMKAENEVRDLQAARATAEQSEPVAWMLETPGQSTRWYTSGRQAMEHWVKGGAVSTPLYGAPQGAAQNSVAMPEGYIELNMSNYDADDVSQLNEWAIAAYGVLEAMQTSRNNVIEECAAVCDAMANEVEDQRQFALDLCSDAIRALKSQQDAATQRSGDGS